MATTPLPGNRENRLANSSMPAVQLQTFNEIMRIATSTLDITEVFEQVGEQVKRLIPWDWLNIALNPPGEDYYKVFAFSQAVPTPQAIYPGTHVPLDQGPPGR